MNANPAMTKRSLRSAKKHENHIARSRGEIVGNVIILIILVQAVQFIGNMLARKLDRK